MTAGDDARRTMAAHLAVGLTVAALLVGGGCSARQGAGDGQTTGPAGATATSTTTPPTVGQPVTGPAAAGGPAAGQGQVPTAGPGADPGSASSPTVPAADEQAIRATIDRLNATAAGDVPDQQAVLASIIDPALSSSLPGCGPATTTLRLEPVYPGLRADPSPTSGDSTAAGTGYALPSLIRIFTGDRITATDLTTLHLDVRAGEAFLTPLCVN